MDTVTKITSLVPRLKEKNYNEWNRNIRAILQKNKLWKYIQSDFSKADKGNCLLWIEKSPLFPDSFMKGSNCLWKA